MASSGGGMYAFPPTLDPSWSLKGSSRYVTVQAPNKGSLATVNIFLVTKSIRACATVEDIRKNFKAGTYTVRVPNEAQAKQLKDKLTVLGDQITKVEVVDDEFRNTSRAVISCRDLIGVTEEQIVEELSEQGIKAARHLKKGVNKVETGSVVITFNKPHPPERVQVACHSVAVRPYYPPPALCYGCFEYGHISKNCRGAKACANCSGPFHGDNIDCPNPALWSGTRFAWNFFRSTSVVLGNFGPLHFAFLAFLRISVHILVLTLSAILPSSLFHLTTCFFLPQCSLAQPCS